MEVILDGKGKGERGKGRREMKAILDERGKRNFEKEEGGRRKEREKEIPR